MRSPEETTVTRGATCAQPASCGFVCRSPAMFRWPACRVHWLKPAGPVIGHLPVDQINTLLLLRCLEPIWTSKTETASRLRRRIEFVLDWSAVRGYRNDDSPGRRRGHLDKLLPRPSRVARIKHHAALPVTEIGLFMNKRRKDTGVAARALELLILTATRTNEAVRSQGSEFDLEGKAGIVSALSACKRSVRTECRYRSPQLPSLRTYKGSTIPTYSRDVSVIATCQTAPCCKCSRGWIEPGSRVMGFDPQETFPKFGLGALLAQSRMAGIAYLRPFDDGLLRP